MGVPTLLSAADTVQLEFAICDSLGRKPIAATILVSVKAILTAGDKEGAIRRAKLSRARRVDQWVWWSFRSLGVLGLRRTPDKLPLP